MKKPAMTAEQWNRLHKPGIGVVVKLDHGKLWHTKTRAKQQHADGKLGRQTWKGRPSGR